MAADIVISVVAKLAEYTIKPVLRPFGYLFYCKSNVDDLNEKITTLTAKRDGLQRQTEVATRNLEPILPEVQIWLEQVNQIIQEKETCFEEGRVEKATTCCSSNRWCPNLKARYFLGRKAAKMAPRLGKLITDGSFPTISCPAPPPKLDYPAMQYFEDSTEAPVKLHEGDSSSSVPSDPAKPLAPMDLSERLEYRLPYTRDLLTALADDKLSVIGISGTFREIDTVTTKEFIRRMKQRYLFEEVVMAVVSQVPDLKRIQGEFAEMLELKLENECLVERAEKLRTVFSAPDSKKLLVVLTDVCGILDFEAIGISHVDIKKRCKIMLVSQVSNVFGEMGTWNNVKLLVPPTPIARPVEFGSRISVIRGVMDALTDDESNPIVVCGMGGIGKTTLVMEIAAKAAEVDIFDEIAIAEFGEEPDLIKIQDKLANDLGRKPEANDDRAAILRERLTGGAKRKLVVLDNVWTQLDLWKIGIPISRDPKSCKLLVSSRDQDLFNDMKTKRNFLIDGLPQHEAWDLFKKMTGGFIESEPELCDIAKQVLHECGGLPIAISTVGKALQGRSISTWRNALRQLQQACPEDVPGVIEDVYGKIEFSYNCLPSQQVRSCFLLCGIFSDIEDLIVSGIGLGLFKGIQSISAGRDCIKTLVDTLRGRSLLLEGDDNQEIRMHDVVRDVAVYIASKELKFKKNDSLEQIVELDGRLMDCFTLTTNSKTTELLFLEGGGELELPATIFDRMEDLKVLIIRDSSLPSLPLLKKLQTLALVRCKLKFDVNVIGEQRALMILDLSESDITKLPDTFKNLSSLRLLNLTKCSKLFVISPGVISSFSRLEELYMWNSFAFWVFEKLASTETTNWISQLEVPEEVDMWTRLNRTAVKMLASEEISDDELRRCRVPDSDQLNRWANCMDWSVGVLSELLSLSGLTTSEVSLPPAKTLVTSKPFHDLKTFKIFIAWFEYEYDLPGGNHLSVFDLDVSCLADTGLGLLLNKTETLKLKMKNLTDPLNVLVCAKLESLTLEDYDSLEYLIDMKLVEHIPQSIFPVLKKMEITGAKRLKEIFHGDLPPGSLHKLRRLYMDKLPSLATIWSTESEYVSVGDVASLESILIKDCQSLEAILGLEGSAYHVKEINFPALTNFELKGLPSFTGISKTTCKMLDRQLEVNSPNTDSLIVEHSLFSDPKIAFPVLSYLTVSGLGELKKIWNGQLSPTSFFKLECLGVEQCDKLLYLVPIQMQDRLPSLKTIWIDKCSSLEEIFEVGRLKGNEGNASVSQSSPASFSKSMGLSSLNVSVCNNLLLLVPIQMQDRLPSLKYIYIFNCSSLEEIFEVRKLKVNEGNASVSQSDKISQSDQGMQLHAMRDFKQSFQGFQKLTELDVTSCGSLRKLLSPTVARGLVKLKFLIIKDCQKMVAVVATEECEDREEVSQEPMLPQLSRLALENLSNLVSFAQEKYTVDWPLMERIHITNCNKMNNFCSGYLSVARGVEIDVCDSGENLEQELYGSRKES